VRFQQHGVPDPQRIRCAVIFCDAALLTAVSLGAWQPCCALCRVRAQVHCIAVAALSMLPHQLTPRASSPPPQMWTSRAATCWQTRSSEKPSRSSATGPPSPRCRLTAPTPPYARCCPSTLRHGSCAQCLLGDLSGRVSSAGVYGAYTPKLRMILSSFPDVQLYIKGEFVGGSDILMGLHRSGDLRTLLSDGPKEHSSA
jgi:hypothetical protein